MPTWTVAVMIYSEVEWGEEGSSSAPLWRKPSPPPLPPSLLVTEMMVAPTVLPQPPCLRDCYTYVPYDVLERDWLGDPLRLKEALSSIGATKVAEDGNENENEINNSSSIGSSDGDQSLLSRYAPGTLVWVLLSRGKKKSMIHHTKGNGGGGNAFALHKKRRDKKNKQRIDVETYNAEIICTNDEDDDDELDVDNDGVIPKQNYSRKEFFLRARVVSDDEEFIIGNNCNDDCNNPTTTLMEKHNLRHVLVRYEGGTTYHVKAYNLIPVLEPSLQLLNPNASLLPKHIVLIVPETSTYRRLAKIHTTPQDSFMEIGCDFGITVDRVRESLDMAGNVPREWPTPSSSSAGQEKNECDDNNNNNNNENETKDITKVSCLGVDKSKDSIDIANQRYPKSKFLLGDVLVPNEISSVRMSCEQCLIGLAPSILCIDINGNREIEGVLACLTMVMNEPWVRMPRIIIVKSRFLYWEMKRQWKGT